MSRKDTIMVAVLINAAILAVLFVSAVKHGEEKPLGSREIVSEKIIEPLALTSSAQTPKMSEPGALQAGAQIGQGPSLSAPLSGETQGEIFSSPPSTVISQDPSAIQLDFVKELEAIARASMQPQGASSLGIQTATDRPEQNTSTADYIEVRVKKGDALAKIAKAHQTTVEEIMNYNQLKTTMLNVGQLLKVPKKGLNSPTSIARISANESSFQTPTVSSGQEPKYYTVKPGDNPWSIAAKNQMKVEELLKLNQLTQEKARHLKPGDKLRIR